MYGEPRKLSSGNGRTAQFSRSLALPSALANHAVILAIAKLDEPDDGWTELSLCGSRLAVLKRRSNQARQMQRCHLGSQDAFA